ncbi:MAG TPA: DNA (cytosine-5-)-methyltransferase, partial [Puia sp.]|nr:DNA (cytosine-5-)-methyltransferase [Puia sp.]
VQNIMFCPPFGPFHTRIWKQIKPGQNGYISESGKYTGFSWVKIDPHKPCHTVQKSCSYAGVSMNFHWKEPRSLTLDELKRVSSFPDAFQFDGTYVDGHNRLGNAVPPKFLQCIAEHIYHTFFNLSDEQEIQHMPLDFIDKPINPPGPYKFTVISTFSGCGGSSLGYIWSGGKILAAVEWDDNAVATYRLNFPDTPILHRDIATVATEELLALTGLQPGELDILDGSPPCQGFSTAGKRQFDDPRNSLFKEYIRLLRGLQPKVFVMENVSGMVKGHMKHVFALVMRELKASGYQVKCQLMNAMYFGVPQSRERVIFIGVRNDLGIEASHPQVQTRLISANEALQTCHVSDVPLFNDKYARLWSRVPIGGNASDVIGKGFTSCIKVDPHRPSNTLPKTQMGRGFATICHWKEPRALSISEAQRLHSFPDAFQFVGTYQDQWARIGNSVPPRFMESIAEHI